MKEPEAQEFEKIMTELANLIVNPQNIKNNDLCLKFDEKRLVTFLLFLLKHQTWIEDPSSKIMNRIFHRLLRDNLNINVDESNDKKYYLVWNLDNIYRITNKYISHLDVRIL